MESVYCPFAGAGGPANDASGISGIDKHGSITRGDLEYRGYLNSIALALPSESLMAFGMGCAPKERCWGKTCPVKCT